MAILQSVLSALLLLLLAAMGSTLRLSPVKPGEEPTINASSCDEALPSTYVNSEPLHVHLPDRLACEDTKVRESCTTHNERTQDQTLRAPREFMFTGVRRLPCVFRYIIYAPWPKAIKRWAPPCPQPDRSAVCTLPAIWFAWQKSIPTNVLHCSTRVW